MFEIGDLVRFKKNGVLTKTREAPHKKIGLISEIVREVYRSYDGTIDDKITIIWLGSEDEESMPEFLLEKITKDT
jgi:hypothetical protein